MSENNAILATSRLHIRTDTPGQKAVVIGTCFAFRNPRFFLTAAHCLIGTSIDKVVIAGEDRDRLCAVKHATFHPTADIAVIEADRNDLGGSNYFRHIPERPSMAMPIHAYGYPTITDDFDPRVFSGIFQRFYHHRSFMRNNDNAPHYDYMAGELSFSCPRGLSGGPVFRLERPDEIVAVVTENQEVSTLVHRRIETEEDGMQFSETEHRVIMYGVSVVLFEIRDWLTETIPSIA